MIRIDDPHSIRLIAQAARLQFIPKWHHCIADYDSRDILRGGCLYTEYWGTSCQMHFAGFRKGWISKSMLWLGFDYPFNQLRVKKVFGLVPEWNVESRNVTLKLGFKIEHLIDDVYNNPEGVNGMYIMGLYKADCRWLGMKKPEIEFAMKVNHLPLVDFPTVNAVAY